MKTVALTWALIKGGWVILLRALRALDMCRNYISFYGSERIPAPHQCSALAGLLIEIAQSLKPELRGQQNGVRPGDLQLEQLRTFARPRPVASRAAAHSGCEVLRLRSAPRRHPRVFLASSDRWRHRPRAGEAAPTGSRGKVLGARRVCREACAASIRGSQRRERSPDRTYRDLGKLWHCRSRPASCSSRQGPKRHRSSMSPCRL